MRIKDSRACRRAEKPKTVVVRGRVVFLMHGCQALKEVGDLSLCFGYVLWPQSEGDCLIIAVYFWVSRSRIEYSLWPTELTIAS